MLPIEVQNALPSDPDRLMDVGFDVIRQAFSKKIHALEAEVAKARSELGTRAKVRRPQVAADGMDASRSTRWRVHKPPVTRGHGFPSAHMPGPLAAAMSAVAGDRHRTRVLYLKPALPPLFHREEPAREPRRAPLVPDRTSATWRRASASWRPGTRTSPSASAA